MVGKCLNRDWGDLKDYEDAKKASKYGVVRKLKQYNEVL
jgi:hypothetical protein